MNFIYNLMIFGVLIFFIIAIINLFRGLFRKNWSPFKKSLIGLIACTTLGFITVPKDADSDTDSNKSSKVMSSKSSSKKSESHKSSSKEESSTQESSSSKSITQSSQSSESSGSLSKSEPATNNDDQTSDDNQNNDNNDNMDDTAQNGKVIGDTKTHIYHTADQHDYKINPANEIIFSNEQQAINAGYRKAKR